MPTSDITNNTFSTATRLTGVTNAPQGGVDQLLNTTTNTLDFYRFTTSGTSNLAINLTGIQGDVQLSLYKAPSATATDAQIVSSQITLRPGSSGRISESYTSTSDAALADVTAGIYYIKVEQAGIALPQSTYSLSVFASTSQNTISALWSNSSGGLDVWQMTGNAIDTKGQFNATDAPAGLKMIGTGDFNADGVDDILWKDTVNQTFVIWFMQNGTVRQSVATIQDSTGVALTSSKDWAVVGLGDIDKDGFTDILLRNQTSGEMSSWFMNGAQVTNSVNLTNGFKLYSDWQIAGFSDSRVLWRNLNSNLVATWDLNRNGVVKSAALSVLVAQDWQVVSFQDFNNDGTPDILWRSTQQQTIALWRMTSASNDPVEIKGYNVRNSFRISAIADFNGDGRPDVLFWDATSGDIVTWTVQQNVVDFTINYVTKPNGDILNIKYGGYNAVLAKDFDGDGKSEILWLDTTSGTSGLTIFWKMDGSVLRDFGTLESVPLTSTPAGIDYYGNRVAQSLKATTIKVPQFTAGSTKASSFDLGVLDGAGSFLDTIGGSSTSDRADWYKFTVEIPSLLTGLNLVNTVGGPSIGAAKVEVFTDRGASSNVAFTQAELLNVLNPDTTTTPGSTIPKIYYIKVTPDAAKKATSTPYTLNITGRLGITNLTADAFTIGQTTLALDPLSSNNKVTVTKLVIENNGDFAANGVNVGYYLSRDGVLDASDVRLTTSTPIGTVARGIAEKVNSDGTTTPGTPNIVTVPVSPTITLNLPGANDPFWTGGGANYQIIAVIDPDNLVPNEKNRTDNTIASTPITITKAGGIDLTGNGFTSISSVSQTGTVTGTFTIQNLGSVALAAGQPLQVNFYFSTDATISSIGDLFIGQIIVTSAISAGGSLVQSFSLALPTNSDAINYWADNKSPGSTQLAGFIGMIIDTTNSNILDANPGNNSNQGSNKDRAGLTVTGLPA